MIRGLIVCYKMGVFVKMYFSASTIHLTNFGLKISERITGGCEIVRVQSGAD